MLPHIAVLRVDPMVAGNKDKPLWLCIYFGALNAWAVDVLYGFVMV
ncbi:MAG: hypothetical protein ACFFDN_36915 [Candidatus Hodarchaeota archaeon]